MWSIVIASGRQFDPRDTAFLNFYEPFNACICSETQSLFFRLIQSNPNPLSSEATNSSKKLKIKNVRNVPNKAYNIPAKSKLTFVVRIQCRTFALYSPLQKLYEHQRQQSQQSAHGGCASFRKNIPFETPSSRSRCNRESIFLPLSCRDGGVLPSPLPQRM